tara:strand:- start:3501 stop:4877 length:1377 start_codon:yes stop_codon:yes gene_type:complete
MTLNNAHSRLAPFFARPGGRILGLGVLILVLLIPLGMINDQVRQRSQQRDIAVADVAQSWGGPQTLAGPLLRLPYTHRWQEARDEEIVERERRGWLVLTPQTLSVVTNLDSEVRRRGIFEVPVYRADVRMRGHFLLPEAASLPVTQDSIDFGRAELLMGMQGPGSIAADSRVRVAGQPLQLEPSAGQFGGQGVHAVVRNGISAQALRLGVHFELDIEVRGSEQFALAPVARQTTLELVSGWPHPGFRGSNLPAEHEISDRGFSARWSASNLGSGYPPVWLDKAVTREQLDQASFGVALVVPVDPYTMATRVAKYGALLLLLSFAAIWVMELLGGRPMHPVQYLLLGGSLCLFGLLQLALAEHIRFAAAFLAASSAVVLQASWYAYIATQHRSRALFLGGLLAGWFGYLYVILQAEDLAFLLGAMALFVALTGVMWATRKVNWSSGSSWDVADAVVEQP